MRTLTAFLKKEWMEWLRSGKFLILLVVFVVFGIMNPAFAKLTPWLMETMAESLESTGLMVADVHVDALSSWTQFYKNVPMVLIVFVLMISTSFTSEYQKGTLILVVTKGLARWKIYVTKAMMFVLLWTGCYWLHYGITYFYNDIYWDNKVAAHPLAAAALIWMFGILLISLVLFFSAMASGNTMVLAGVGAVVVVSYIAEMFPKICDYMPTRLLGGMGILSRQTQMSDYRESIVVTLAISIIVTAMGIVLFNRKKI